MELLRCYDCRKLWYKPDLMERTVCTCGRNRVMEALPSSFLEELMVIWWRLTRSEQ